MAIDVDDDFGDPAAHGESLEWVSVLDETLAKACNDWQLQLGEQYKSGMIGYVARATKVREGDMHSNAPTKLAIKARSADWRMLAEADALELFNGSGTPAIIERNDALGVMLLERIEPGEALATATNEVDINEVFVSLVTQMWNAGGNVDVVTDSRRTVTNRAQHWLENIEMMPSDGFLSGQRRARCLGYLRDLAQSDHGNLLLHGDMHIENVIRSGTQSWKAIDPKGLIGSKSYEAAWWIRDPAPGAHAEQVSTYQRRLDTLCDAFDIDRSETIAWTYVGSAVCMAAREAAMIRWDAERFSASLDAIAELR